MSNIKKEKIMFNMRQYDTMGNIVYEEIGICTCGLTGGCKECNPILFQFQKECNPILFQFQSVKLWGLFKGLRVDDDDIEEAKKSLFPIREVGK